MIFLTAMRAEENGLPPYCRPLADRFESSIRDRSSGSILPGRIRFGFQEIICVHSRSFAVQKRFWSACKYSPNAC